MIFKFCCIFIWIFSIHPFHLLFFSYTCVCFMCYNFLFCSVSHDFLFSCFVCFHFLIFSVSYNFTFSVSHVPSGDPSNPWPDTLDHNTLVSWRFKILFLILIFSGYKFPLIESPPAGARVGHSSVATGGTRNLQIHKITKHKHRKNCKCCPGHYLIVNHYSSMSWFKFSNL